jgi:hypothetical protein
VKNFTTVPLPTPPNVWTRFLDHVGENPWHVGGPILGCILLAIIRSVRGSWNQDALIRALDEVSPLHSREVAMLGRDNGVSVEEWDATWTTVVSAVRERRKAQGVDATPSLEYERVHPSEVEAALALATGGRPLLHSHILHRAAAWLRMKELGVLKVPTTDEEAHVAIRVREGEKAGSNWWGVASAETEEVSKGSILSTLGALTESVLQSVGVLGKGRASESVPPPFTVLPADIATPSDSLWDSPLPLLTALSLYGCCVGLAEEEDKAVGDGKAVGNITPSHSKFTPSRRLNTWVEMCREVLGLAGVAGMAEAGEGDRAPFYTVHELERLVDLLGGTFQLPSRVRITTASTLPDFHYTVAPSGVIVDAALKEATVDLKKSPALAPLPNGVSPPPPSTAAEQVPGSIAGLPKPLLGAKELDVAREWVTRDEAMRALLLTRAACIWGECNKKKVEYKGFFQ